MGAPVLSTAVMCVGLRRFRQALLWNLLLKAMGVDAAERRDIALRAARLDLKVDDGVPASRGRRPRQPATAHGFRTTRFPKRRVSRKVRSRRTSSGNSRVPAPMTTGWM
jgi:hypothetical protein